MYVSLCLFLAPLAQLPTSSVVKDLRKSNEEVVHMVPEC